MALHWALVSNGEAILDRQCMRERIAAAAIDQCPTSAALSRLCAELAPGIGSVSA